MAEKDLQYILTSTNKFLAGLPVVAIPPDHSHVSDTHIPPLRLAEPTANFHSGLLQMKLFPQISHLVLSKARELAMVYQRSYDDMCRLLVALPLGSSTTQVLHNQRLTHEHLYARKCLPQLLGAVVKAQALSGKKPLKCSAITKERRSFNHEYTPLLTKYFEHNAYPSAPDRLMLARKTMMTPRQIEVWFQNHRNRGRKEGRTLQRWTATNSLPLYIFLDPLEPQMPSFTLPHNERSALDDGDSSDDDPLDEDSSITPIPSLSNDVFSAAAPPHAYPTKYPPNCAHDPFPRNNGTFKFLPPVWRRKPMATKVRQTPVDDVCMNEFVNMFASKLNLGEGVQKSRNSKRSCQPWFSATVIPVIPAPHPALVQTPYLPRSTSPFLPSLLAQPSSQPIHSLTTRTYSEPNVSKPRKLAPLPQRFPTNPPSQSDSSDSRTPSLSSVTSFQSRSSSSFSTSSIDPPTPPLSPAHKPKSLGEQFTSENLAFFNEILNAAYTPAPKEANVRSSSFSSRETFAKPFGLSSLPRTTSAFLAACS